MSEQPASSPVWRIEANADTYVLHLTGDWLSVALGADQGTVDAVASALVGLPGATVRTDAIGRWDTGLIVYLLQLRAAVAQGFVLDDTALSKPVARLLRLAEVGLAAPSPPMARPTVGWLARLGWVAIRGGREAIAVSDLLGSTLLRTGVGLTGRSQTRRGDVIALMRDAGAGALAIVAVVNFLVGGILAFVGAVQLERFGAEIFVANLVGVAVVREMAAIMTAIVLAGRTGGAYAAEIAAMQGAEEIDALAVLGVSIQDYLILPRVVALSTMMPLLYVYGCAFGLLGGLLVAVLTLDLSATSFVNQLIASVNADQFWIGLSKSVVFGLLIALAGCRLGLKAGRSASDVGRAATAAVVAGIVGVIAVDAVFALCANALGI
ncbi:MAG: ABC transporter permease [Alphaproteobacteria bacterium]|nr:MAG: ABC transporter permease [Alphaproteobacteria bacterium]